MLDPIEGKKPLLDYCQEIANGQSIKNHLPKSLKYLEEYGKGIKLGSVTERWVEGYQAFLLSKGLLKSTASHYSSALRMAHARAVRDLIIPRNPAQAVKNIQIPETEKINLTPDEIAKLNRVDISGNLGAEVKRAFLFGCLTGLRISDLRALEWGNIQRDPLQVLKRQAKTGRVVAVPLTDSAFHIIDDRALHPRNELVFPMLTASKTNTNQYLDSWAIRAGLQKKIGWHTARHTYAVLLLEGGADFCTVSKLMGHTKATSTAVYAKATDGMKRKAVEGLPEFDF